MKVIDAKDFEALSPIFRGEWGHRLAEFIIRMMALDKVNQVYDRSGSYTGARFTEGLLNDFGVNYVIGNAERLNHLPKGAFITVSNHPYGGLDGIMLIDLMARFRPDYKLMVNRILALVKTMKENFIAVTPVGNKKESISVTSIHGIRETLTHLSYGHPVGFFPSGAVSDFRLKNFRVRDRSWQKSILHLIHSVKVPILPIRFFDKNSAFFYFLGLIHSRIRLLRMPREVFNKRKQEPRIGIGNIISVEEQKRYPDSASLGAFLRKIIYDMPKPDTFIPRNMINFQEQQPKIKLA
ncbi:MAG: 1-acyl-sn-glycerol-3-phosphate acyltransferase [Bacteroidales bacterium]|nr:1-acyl-sn-glycerol-3-phosphate acyltransferase [Bacteroidales bacterium]